MRWIVLFGWWVYVVLILVTHADGVALRSVLLDGMALCGSLALLCWEAMR